MHDYIYKSPAQLAAEAGLTIEVRACHCFALAVGGCMSGCCCCKHFSIQPERRGAQRCLLFSLSFARR